MTVFFVLQVIFDAVLMFGILFLFHYSVQRVQRKKDEDDLLKNLEAQEIREDLQELLSTLRQVGEEVSGQIQGRVREAEGQAERLSLLTDQLRKDTQSISVLAQEINGEKNHLEQKVKVLKAARRRPKAPPPVEKDEPGQEPVLTVESSQGRAIGFPTGAVKEIYRMADAEMDVSEIARRTQLTRGEVQLILNLRGNRFSTPN